MNKQLDTAKEYFSLFKKISNYIKDNFVNVLQTILILIMILGMYLGYQWVIRKMDEYPTGSYTVEETKEGFKSDTIINAILDDMLETYTADRAKLIQFHNGTHSLGGIPFKYISITHERVRSGVSSEILRYQNIPTSILGSFTKVMMEGDPVVIKDVNNVNENAFGQLLRDQAIQARCMYPIFDLKGRFTGYLAVDWVNRAMPQPLDGSCICDDLMKESNIIENILFSSED